MVNKMKAKATNKVKYSLAYVCEGATGLLRIDFREGGGEGGGAIQSGGEGVGVFITEFALTLEGVVGGDGHSVDDSPSSTAFKRVSRRCGAFNDNELDPLLTLGNGGGADTSSTAVTK